MPARRSISRRRLGRDARALVRLDSRIACLGAGFRATRLPPALVAASTIFPTNQPRSPPMPDNPDESLRASAGRSRTTFDGGAVPPGRHHRQGGDVDADRRVAVVVGGDLRQGRPAPAPPARRRAFRGELLVGRVARRSLRPHRRRPADPMSAVFAAAMREWRRSSPRGLASTSRRRPRRTHRARHARDGRARDGPARTVHDVPRHGRLDRAFRRAVRHGLGHHGQLPVDRRGQEHHPRGGGAGHRQIAVRDRARDWSRRSPRSSPNKFRTDFGRYAGRLDALPPSSAPSCRASSTRRLKRCRRICRRRRCGGDGRRPAISR